jgi:hypothetical protein
MEIDIYDGFNRIGIIDKIASLIWTRRYWFGGEFKMLVPATAEHLSLLQKQRLVVRRDDAESGEIRYMSIKRNTDGGEEIEVQGRFLSGWLGKRLVLSQIITTDTTPAILQRLVDENVLNPTDTARVIPDIYLTDVSGIDRDPINYTSEFMATVLGACESAALASKLGIRITTDMRECKHYFEVYEGRDLTWGNGTYNPVVFSPDFNNILSQEFTNSIENYRTTAFVAGAEAEGITRTVVAVGDAIAGLDRNEVYIDGSDVPQTYEGGSAQIPIPQNEYEDMLSQRGLSELEHFLETLSFSSKINPHAQLVYKKDYDIGDRVTCINRKWGVRIDVRITEITETYQPNNPQGDIDITFGESLPSLLDTIRQIRR